MTRLGGGAAVFLDRDGVLNELVLHDGVYGSPRAMRDFKIRPDAAQAVNRLRSWQLPILVVTNQPDIRRGLMPQDVLEEMLRSLRAAVPVDDVAVCTHDDADGCECRKPKPGLLLELAARWEVDLAQSFMVGDSWRDVGAGRAAGCRTILIADADQRGTDPDSIVPDLIGAVAEIGRALLLRGQHRT